MKKLPSWCGSFSFPSIDAFCQNRIQCLIVPEELLMSLAAHQQLDENGQAVKQMAMNCIAEICSTFSREFPIRLAAHQQSDENGVARFHRRQRSDVYLVPRVRKGVCFECPAAPQSV